MADLESPKRALRQKAEATTSCPKQPLSDGQYITGFNIVQGSEWKTCEDFIVPQLIELLTPLLNSRTSISALEIGPGPKSLLGYLPNNLKKKVKKYTAFEPQATYCFELEEWLCPPSKTESPLPCLEFPPAIHPIPFVPQDDVGSGTSADTRYKDEKYDIVLFCHSMYGMTPKRNFIEQALKMLVEQPQGGLVVVFHRDGALNLDGLACHRTASFPTGVVRVADDDKVLDDFTPFIAGFTMQDVDVDQAIRADWRQKCRALGRREEAHPNHLSFSAPNVMATFTQHATALPELAAQVPLVMGRGKVKNWEAQSHIPAAIVKPTNIRQVQQCVRWALKHRVGLTVIGGGHSGHCLLPNVVSVDMSAFNKVRVIAPGEEAPEYQFGPDSGHLVIAEAGCKTGDIVHKTTEMGIMVPLGARPSVGAGSWLQGGIGHQSRLRGLACDAIIGAVVVSIKSGQVFRLGSVPTQHCPADAVHPENEADLLWLIKGAGTSFAIVVSVVFTSYEAPTYSIQNWVIPLNNNHEARLKLSEFDELVARKLPNNCSADAYLFWDASQLHLGVAVLKYSITGFTHPTLTSTSIEAIWGPGEDPKIVDGVGLFETEMYMSALHGGHGGGKTSTFKRCLFLKNIGEANIANRLIAAFETRPTPFCYLHLEQGGGAVSDVGDGTAFGCRDWHFACIITGVWPRNQDGTETAQSTVQWVYDIAGDLLSLSRGAYCADLGPDPRDAVLASKAFGGFKLHLAHFKHSLDPHNVLPYASPIPKPPKKLIILVTGESGAGKDYCAGVWTSTLTRCADNGLTARVLSISEETKREYAEATGADLSRLLQDRAYKEQHRPMLTTFFKDQVWERPSLPEEHLLNVVFRAADVDVLIITGMRDEAPVATFAHVVPHSRLLEVRVRASEQTRQIRRGYHGDDSDGDDNKDSNNSESTALDSCPSFVFDNDATGNEAADKFAEKYLLPYLQTDLQRLVNLVPVVRGFPRAGFDFRHVLGIAQQPGGLALCTSLFQTHFTGDWAKIQAVVGCEAGGFVYASPLALRVDVPVVLIREAGKLPPPNFSATKFPSLISSVVSNKSKEKRMEMERGVVPRGASVVVVDDVLSTGATLCAVLELLGEAGIEAEDITVMVVAEFPVHDGRNMLRRCGFGKVNVQSLLVFGGD
ncbi:MAG: hypothetical protein M1822_006528 [Bathelium mastoideum]|nr:MAG: hypothetical protein M1822_006528 [Bathelium mastoideum]